MESEMQGKGRSSLVGFSDHETEGGRRCEQSCSSYKHVKIAS